MMSKHNIFVSYKYNDTNVRSLQQSVETLWKPTKVRDYVNVIETMCTKDDIGVYYGEHDGEDFSHLKDPTIWEKLKDKIYKTTVTIVLISPGMKVGPIDKDQWIPQEISYSLRNQSRDGRTSHRNSLLFIILPDKNGGYYYPLFMPQFEIVNLHRNSGYAEVVNWNQFLNNPTLYIEKAIQRNNNEHDVFPSLN